MVGGTLQAMGSVLQAVASATNETASSFLATDAHSAASNNNGEAVTDAISVVSVVDAQYPAPPSEHHQLPYSWVIAVLLAAFASLISNLGLNLQVLSTFSCAEVSGCHSTPVLFV